ncbi:MAG: hypothetical protein PCFJNLEI_03456 [Verrucomicrobiae bacterium]|nr:hypothetical protein [Verrucomicrobiae bacterium]
MSDETKIDIPADVRSHLDEIAERLWSGHAAVMVGAGFSRNARKAIPSAIDFPTWPQLADHFYDKIHHRLPDADTSHYLSPLKLADEVQAAFGRPALDQLLRTRIPDKEYEPSDLHVRLLHLPWVDVFTVNYDTLLERATTKVTSYRFDVVVNKEDLVYSTRPRIVKLHGSFPSTRPFTISEEDYRRYPREQAPFVNTVQQSLLENTLCLIGFSGDDPNFLHWIGWVRDNLGKENSPKIYLVGVLSLTVGQRELLEQRNVIPIDLSRCLTVGSDHATAVSIFLKYLIDRKPAVSLDWPTTRLPSSDPSKPAEPVELTHALSAIHESYPNWVIAPDESRESLLSSIRHSHFGFRELIAAESAAPPTDIELLYELNWCLERVLIPIPNDLVQHFERILSRYNPYPKLINVQSAEVTPERQEYLGLAWKGISPCWIDLNIAMLRFYREEAVPDKWKVADSLLQSVAEVLWPEQAARWHYERCLQALFGIDLGELRSRIGAWPVNPAQPFWEAKRAGLLAELGDLSEAESILEDSLAAIRSKQQLAPVVKDFTWVSQESHAMYLLRSVQLANRFAHGQVYKKNVTSDHFQQRWNELKAFKCEPWDDLRLFDVRLKIPPVPYEPVTHQREFDIGRETVTHHLGSGDDNASLTGYAFLRYCEEVGLPFALPSLNIAQKQAQQAAERISQSSSSWAVTTLLRIGDPKLADSLFSRDALALMNVTQVDEAVDRFIDIFKRAQFGMVKGVSLTDRGIGDRVISMVPEVLSRFCTKCSTARRDAIFALLRELYEKPPAGLSDGIRHLAQRLLNSWTSYEQYKRLPNLIEFPVFGDANGILSHYFTEPFMCLSVKKDDLPEKVVAITLSETSIAALIKKVASTDPKERSHASVRLGCLHELGLLSESQSTAFGEVLWSRIGPNGFPSNTPFFPFAFLSLPSPAGTDALAIFKKYVASWSHVMIDATPTGGITVTPAGKPPINMTGGQSGWCNSILGVTKRTNNAGGIDWTTDEVVMLLDKLVDWWNAGKERLREPDPPPHLWGSIPDEFRARYQNLIMILGDVIVPRLTAKSKAEVRQRLGQLVEELDSFGMPVLRLRAACLHVFPQWSSRVLESMAAMLQGSEKKPARDACNAILDLLRRPKGRANRQVMSLLSTIGQQVKWRREILLAHALKVLEIVINEIPECLSDALKSDILTGLSALRTETSSGTKEPFKDIADRLVYREHAAALAYSLSKYLTKRGEPIPSVLMDWQKVCADPEEFAEIRNQWPGNSERG